MYIFCMISFSDIEDLSDDNAKLNAKLNLLQKNLLAKDSVTF